MPETTDPLVDTSQFNLHESFRGELDFPEEITIADTTLRDGEQTPGVVFSPSDKVAIARRLDDIGVDRIEAGNLAVSRRDRSAIEDVVAADLDADVFVLSRALKSDVETALDLDVDGVYVFSPTSGRAVEGEPDFDFTDTYEVTRYARDHGLHVTFFPFDNARVDTEVVTEAMAEVDGKGAVDSVSVIDRAGSANPHAIRYLVEEMVDTVDMPVEVHCHDDFGLATANALFAASAGAEVIDTTVNGLGERTGNPDLGQVAAGLKHLYDRDVGIDLTELRALSKEVERRANLPVAPDKPLVGDNAFRFSSGYIMHGIRQNLFTPIAVHPKAVGQSFSFLLGKNSTRVSLEMKLEERGVDPAALTDEDYDALLERVTRRSEVQKRPLEDHEFYEMVREVRSDVAIDEVPGLEVS